MEKVAEHINEMQRIHEEYGAIFDHLFRQHQKACKQVNAHLITLYMLYFVFHLLLNSSSFFIHFIQNIIKKRMFQPIDLSPGDLLYYGGVEWLNISDFLGKIKKVQIVCTVNEMIRQFIFMFLAVLLVMIIPTNFWKKVKTSFF